MLNKTTKINAGKASLRDRGLSLAEAGLVLALGMIASVLAFAAYSTGSKNITTTSQVNAAIELQNNITRAYSAAKDYSGLDNTVVFAGGLLPKGFRSSSSGSESADMDLTSAWGGEIQIGPSPDNAAFAIGFADIPQNACVDFVSGIASTESTIYFGNDLLKSPSTSLDVAQLASACSSMADTGAPIVMGTASFSMGGIIN